MGDRSDYRFGPLERRGLIAGWRGGQIVSVAVGLLVAVGALRARPSAASITLAVAALASGFAVACWPVAGRTSEEWLPTVLRWGTDRAAPSHRRGIGPHLRGHRSSGEGFSVRAADGPPGVFNGLTLLAVDAGRRDEPALINAAAPSAVPAARPMTIGVVRDVRTRTFTAVLAVRGHNFALLGPEDKERRVGGWSAMLASLAREGSSLHRIGWFASTIPDAGEGIDSYVATAASVPEHHPPRRSYQSLLAEASATACRQYVYLAVQVRAGRRVARTWRSRPGHHDAVSCAALTGELRSLSRRLNEIDVDVAGVLGPTEVAAIFGRAVEVAPSGRSGPAPPADGAVDVSRPMATRAEWGHLRTDATFHATYWIAEWPRIAVGPDFLGPLLLGPVRRTLAVVMEPLSPSRATRQVEQARTADLADAELRRRGGFLATARRQRERELVVRREAELADGHASYRFSGYVTVTATTLEQLREACEATEQAAGQARLELRRLYGEQEQAFLFTLPLCRGLS